jgi:hypothetical protein
MFHYHHVVIISFQFVFYLILTQFTLIITVFHFNYKVFPILYVFYIFFSLVSSNQIQPNQIKPHQPHHTTPHHTTPHHTTPHHTTPPHTTPHHPTPPHPTPHHTTPPHTPPHPTPHHTTPHRTHSTSNRIKLNNFTFERCWKCLKKKILKGGGGGGVNLFTKLIVVCRKADVHSREWFSLHVQRQNQHFIGEPLSKGGLP